MRVVCTVCTHTARKATLCLGFGLHSGTKWGWCQSNADMFNAIILWTFSRCLLHFAPLDLIIFILLDYITRRTLILDIQKVATKLGSATLYIIPNTVVDPGFPVGGRGRHRGDRGLPRWLRFKIFICQNKRIWTLGGRAPGTPLDPPMKYTVWINFA